MIVFELLCFSFASFCCAFCQRLGTNDLFASVVLEWCEMTLENTHCDTLDALVLSVSTCVHGIVPS